MAATQQIAHWLKRRGMSEYVEGFAENDIDSPIFASVTHANHESSVLLVIATLELPDNFYPLIGGLGGLSSRVSS